MKKKLGPLPTWAWLLIGAGLVGVLYVYSSNKNAQAAQSPGTTPYGDYLGPIYGGGGGGGGGGSSHYYYGHPAHHPHHHHHHHNRVGPRGRGHYRIFGHVGPRGEGHIRHLHHSHAGGGKDRGWGGGHSGRPHHNYSMLASQLGAQSVAQLRPVHLPHEHRPH